ncbi:MAG TPA: ferredoxin, partial [Stackebrandtia sp.]|uniref:ferredoxin n=1 Tax=Stackebrandtia sp. TaxID=2023065 RepID=UPI002D470EDD
MKIKADREVCIGAGMCVLTAPDLFDQDDEEGRVLVKHVEPASDQEGSAREAVSLCPSGALSLDEG